METITPIQSTLNDSLVAQTVSHIQQFLVQHPITRFANSLGAEDMVLTHIIRSHRLALSIFTLDTGRLNPETYDLLAQHQDEQISTIFPDHKSVEHVVQIYGINGFYNSVQARKACCKARKIEPLLRALEGANGWVTGLRKAQSEQRGTLKLIEHDSLTQLPKCNPLLDWSDDDLKAYIQNHAIRINPLHAQGYPSIGCAPCTRAVGPNESNRSGRWWWEQDDIKECGLHLGPDGKLIRKTKETIQ
jgi:phosphoadenosine phosphosulfate reductase